MKTGIMLDLTDTLEMRIVYAALCLFHGDYPESYKSQGVWDTEVERIMNKFPAELRSTWRFKSDS